MKRYHILILLICGCAGNKTDHFDGRRYHNYEKTGERGKVQVIKWFFTRDKTPWPTDIPENYGPAPVSRVSSGKLKVTFINHASVLVQADGKNILFDPVWSYRVSPLSFIGPARVKKPGIRFKDLPQIDIVAISHDHYDHMDLPTLLRLKEKFDPFFITLSGCKKRLKTLKSRKIIELDWWQYSKIGKMEIHAVPARHSSGRSLTDRDTTLWGGFVILTSKGPVYFAGDTGYGIHFRMIRKKFGPMRFSMLPIGAYKPRWFMKPVHMNPSDALNAHFVLKSFRSMAIHFGTFPLADEGINEPIREMSVLLNSNRISPTVFIIPVEGVALNIPPL
ncbi:MBL fold metallo-hydrolase [Myxococcota bacterium]|nr:MBL fold metallo-hydrolase [Myxococcota bacterium]MBU1380304.1 MBL fold metallo-hydrolase [Myxococcota bacterium]MBU1495292.1 MBL fold metallo-hydrolase [Myxococcota bacterium]